MRRDRFEEHFRRAAEQARNFARGFIEEPLPDATVFRVHLNRSHDAHATSEFKLFPEDSSNQHALAMKGVSGDEVISGLWRDGYVPQWIDIAVAGETGAATVIDVIACGRFIDDEQRLYYASTDVAPFGVKGPALPAGYVQGQRFSIHERSSCWSLEDLERAGRHAAKVWSLELHGPAFDDNALATMPTFSRLEILELTGFALKGSLVAMPSALQAFTIHAADASDDDVRRILSGCPMSLESLGLRGTPVSDRVLEDLERFRPRVRRCRRRTA